MKQITFQVHNHDVAQRERQVENHLTEVETKQLIDDGYLRLRSRLEADYCEELKRRTMELLTQRYGNQPKSTYKTNKFAGQYLRQPYEADITFIDLLSRSYPFVDIVRSLIGPRIAIRAYSVRVTHPFSGDGTAWHSDQRSFVSPQPPLFTEPHIITLGIYLDGADERMGPLCFIPGSHRWHRQPTDEEHFAPLPNQQTMCFEPGEAVLFDAAIWHRGGENRSAAMRRMVIVHLAPIFCKPAIYETTSPSAEFIALISRLRESGDEPMLELLGFNGLKTYPGFM